MRRFLLPAALLVLIIAGAFMFTTWTAFGGGPGLVDEGNHTCLNVPTPSCPDPPPMPTPLPSARPFTCLTQVPGCPSPSATP